MVRGAGGSVDLSQWSLTFEVRKSSVFNNFYNTVDRWSQWSLTFEVRKRTCP